MKKLLIFVLVLLTFTRGESQTITTDEAYYRILSEDNKTAELFRLFPMGESMDIPQTVIYNEVDYTVTAIADSAADDISWLKTLTLPPTLKRIGKNAFGFCDGLKAITLPEGLEELGANAFRHSSIEQVRIPASVKQIGPYAFNSSSLQSISVAEDNAVYDSREDCNAIVETASGTLVLGCNSTIVPASVKVIGSGVFYACKGLSKVELPENLTVIGNEAFYYCTGLQEIELPKNLVNIGNQAFFGCSGIQELRIPKSVEHIGKQALAGSEDMLLSVESGNPCYDSREDCNAIIESKTNCLIKGSNKSRIPSTVTSIGTAAFQSCTGITAVDLPDGLTVIEGQAFYGCKNLSHISIPKSLTTIGHIAFGYTAITEMDLPSQVDSIGSYAFIACRQLERVKIPETVAHFGDKVFASCESLTEVNLPSGLTKVGQGMFSYCGKLSYVEIPSGVKNIEYEAFYHCSALQSINFPDGLETIGGSAFFGCSSLEKVSLPNTVRTISGNAFDSCTALSEVTLGNQVENIGWEAFQRSSIREITLPATLRECGQYLFAYCDQLTSITVLAVTPPRIQHDWGSMVPKDKFATVTLYVPAGSVDAYRLAAEWKNFKNIVALPAQDNYRPFVEDGKVWKVGDDSGNPVQRVEYYYFDGDTIIDGRTCKQMMLQRYVVPSHPDYDIFSKLPSLSYVGAWYEEDKKVYVYSEANKQFKLTYDFSIDANGIFIINEDYPPYVVGPRQMGGIKGFKGVYRDIMMSGDDESTYNTTWLEGIGNIDGPIYSVYYGKEYHGGAFLMSCTVGDEIIYLNDEYEDGATPAEARKRFDFTHTIKTQPKAPKMEPAQGEGSLLYGEYNNLQLDINLDPLDDTYQVRITDETGKVVYEKTINAASIVGLNIDISAYPEGRYTVTVENSRESFTGEFETQATGIEEIVKIEKLNNERIYNLQGQRVNATLVNSGKGIVNSGSLKKGLIIVNGQKVLVK